MKIALYIEDGRRQIILTPESDTEKSLLKLIGPDTKNVKVQAFQGGFYRCQGGWTRESAERDSAIIVLDVA